MAKCKADVARIRVDLSAGIFSDVRMAAHDIPSSDELTDISDDAAPNTSERVIPPSIEREKLYRKFEGQIITNTALDRSLVSNQANKERPFYSWFRYREGFSEPFVDYVIDHALKGCKPGILLDPFAGAGSALFAASARGWHAKGIELLPVGVYTMQARLIAARVNVDRFLATVSEIMSVNFADYYNPTYELKHIAITKGAFPQSEERQLVGYITYCQQNIAEKDIQILLLYAAMCILEEISYTRKDGQYLRWDARSGRSQGEKPFHKGKISPFREAIENKLKQMASDLGERYIQHSLFGDKNIAPSSIFPEIYEGSSLDIFPLLESNSIDAVITFPPYANRYDYTRTYALELVYLGCSGDEVKRLRQDMLSCTVENKDKRDHLYSFFQGIGREVDFQNFESAFQNQEALQEILTILDTYQAQGTLNNPGIASLVRNYFYEMCFVVHELARILKSGGTIVMVNDNVRYAGEEVPVDLILSALAEAAGLAVKCIWTLGRGKGNSSQQMGNHGRAELRKCVYIWEKNVAMAQARDQLLTEAHQMNYRLRSTFFYRKIKAYAVLAFPSMVANLFPTQELYSWDERANWGVGEDAFTYISSHSDIHSVFK